MKRWRVWLLDALTALAVLTVLAIVLTACSRSSDARRVGPFLPIPVSPTVECCAFEPPHKCEDVPEAALHVRSFVRAHAICFDADGNCLFDCPPGR
jgi:hypothetical protein